MFASPEKGFPGYLVQTSVLIYSTIRSRETFHKRVIKINTGCILQYSKKISHINKITCI